MPPVLRKRKAPAPAPEPEPPVKRTTKAKVAKAATKVKEAAAEEKETKPTKAAPASKAKANGSAAAADAAPAPAAPVAAKSAAGKPAVGDIIDLESFGGEVETNEGEKTTLQALVDQSKAGVVLFTYPKASTPGCTTQVCLFRDSYSPLTAGGLAIYGLSTDSPKANTTFRTKQNLPYPLLCDPAATLIAAIGLKKTPKGTQRGVFMISKEGKVLLAEPGGPAGTVDAVKKVVAALAEEGNEDAAAKVEEEAKTEGVVDEKE